MPSSGGGVAGTGSRGLRLARDAPDDLLAVVVGVAVHRLERLGALEVDVQVVLPREADAAVHLDRLAAHLARGVAHVVFFFKQKTAYEIGLGIPAEPLFRSSISSLQTHNVNRCGRSRHLARKLSLRRKRSSPNVFEMAATETITSIILIKLIRVSLGTVRHPRRFKIVVIDIQITLKQM